MVPGYFTVAAVAWLPDALDLKPETWPLKPCLKPKSAVAQKERCHVHPERSDGSFSGPRAMLRYAQHDMSDRPMSSQTPSRLVARQDESQGRATWQGDAVHPCPGLLQRWPTAQTTPPKKSRSEHRRQDSESRIEPERMTGDPQPPGAVADTRGDVGVAVRPAHECSVNVPRAAT